MRYLMLIYTQERAQEALDAKKGELRALARLRSPEKKTT